MLILRTTHLDITLVQFFFLLINFIHFTLVLVTWSLLFVCGCRRLIYVACKDRVKYNYFRLILSHRKS